MLRIINLLILKRLVEGWQVGQVLSAMPNPSPGSR